MNVLQSPSHLLAPVSRRNPAHGTRCGTAQVGFDRARDDILDSDTVVGCPAPEASFDFGRQLYGHDVSRSSIVDLSFQLAVVTGVSGSGQSSLVFDTICAEE